MTFNHLFLAIMATFAFGCAHKPETAKSRTYLNCVYHQHYVLGLAQANAEAKCR